MKREEPGLSRKWIALYRILGVIALGMGAVILGVSVYALYLSPGPRSSAAPQANQPAAAPTERYFTGVGRLRAASADPVPATVIVSIAFPYDSGDAAFSEELAAHLQDFRDLTMDLFSSYTADKLRSLGEGTIKQELLRRWNSVLRLGKITVLYFNDYLIVQ